MSDAEEALAYARGSRSATVAELKELLRFPSVSGAQMSTEHMLRCARWIARHLRSIGLNGVRVVRTAGHPFVYAEWRGAPGRPTLLVYGHYDVQPPGRSERWRSPPFEPTVREGELFARGASDDKGQLFAHIKAIGAYLKTSGRLPVNVRCVFDGEEEIGSPALVRLLGREPGRLRADVAIVSDTRFLARERPAITHSLRGLLGCTLTVRGPAGERHAGHFGGVVLNPLEVLCDMIDGLHDTDGRIAIGGFYDRVRPVQRRPWLLAPRDAAVPGDPRPLEIAPGSGERGFTPSERATARPALSVIAIDGGADGNRAGATIPAAATATLDVRLVPDQEPVEVERLLRRHIATVAPTSASASIRTRVRVPPVVIDPAHPAIRAAARAFVRGFGNEPAFVGSGGTIPVVSALDRALGVPVVLMGFGLPDDNVHAPNEKFRLANLFRGIETSIAFLEEVGAA